MGFEGAPIQEKSPREVWEAEYKLAFERAVGRAKTPEQLATIVETLNMDGNIYDPETGTHDAERMAMIVRTYAETRNHTLMDEGVADVVAKRLFELTRETSA